MKRILVTTDFSKLAESAFGPAAALSKHYGATITLAYVVDSLEYNATYPYPDLSRFRSEIEAAAREGLARHAELLLSLGAANVETAYRIGTPSAEVADLIDSEPGFDLVVLATHGWTGFRRFLIGSVAEAIARRATCPVLSVHTSHEGGALPFELQKILVASDLSELSDTAVQYAVSLAKSFGATIEVAHVFRGPLPVAGMDVAFTIPLSTADLEALRGSFERALHQQLERLEADTSIKATLLEGLHPAEALADYALRQGFDAIVACSHGRRGVQRMVMGSVAERLMRMSEVPVFVVKS